MSGRSLKPISGVTLMEVTLAVAIFAVAIAMSAQALVSFYAAIDVQEQRVESMQAARAVLSAVRQKRVDFEAANDSFNWSGYLNWIATQQTAGWSTYLRSATGYNKLNNHSITVSASNAAGTPAVAGDDPIEVHVRSTWKDLRGRDVSVEVVGTISEK